MSLDTHTETQVPWHETHFTYMPATPAAAYEQWRLSRAATLEHEGKDLSLPEALTKVVFEGILPLSEAKAAYERGFYGS